MREIYKLFILTVQNYVLSRSYFSLPILSFLRIESCELECTRKPECKVECKPWIHTRAVYAVHQTLRFGLRA